MESLTKDLPVARSNGDPADSLKAEITCILDTIDLPIIVVGRDCTVARFNVAATDAFGLTMSDIGRRPGSIRALDEFRDIETLCAQVIADAAPLRREVRLADRWFLLRLAPCTGSDGQSPGTVLTFTNITGFRESIGQAIYEREYLKAILNTVNDAFVVLDKELRVQTGNRTFYEMFGISREVAQGVPLNNLGNDAWRALDVWPSLRATLLDTGDFRTTEVQRDVPSGWRRTLLLEACRLSSKGSTLVLLVLRDVTERKQAEEAVRASEQNYRHLALELERVNKQLAAFLETAAIALHRVGADGTILWANDAEFQMLGYSREEYIGHHIAEFHADKPVITDILKRLTCGEKLYDYEARLRCKDGSIKTVLIDSSVLREDGRFIHTQCFTRDITEKKRAEESLRETNQRLTKVLEVETVGVMFWDLSTGCLVDANDTFLKMMGYSRADVESRSLTWQKFTPPEYHDLSRAEVAKFMATGRVGPYEKEYFHKDGSRQWLLFAGSSLGNNRCVEFCVDISERKKIEQALRESEERFRAVLDNSTAVIFVKDCDGKHLLVNKRYEALFHVAPQAAVGKTDFEMFPPDIAQKFRVNDLEVIRTGKPLEVEEIAPHDDGPHTYFSIKFPLRRVDGSIYAVAGICTDINDRKRAQLATQRLAAIVEHSDDAILSTGLDGIIQSWNRGAERLYGYSEAEAIGRSIGFLDPETQDEQSSIFEHIRQGQTVENYETVRRRKDGSLFHVSLTMSPVKDSNGSIIGVSKVARDITEKVRSREILEQTVAQRTASLEQALAQMEDFTYSVSHDLRAPARSVRGFAQAVIEDHASSLPAEVLDFLEKISASAQRMDQLIRDILEYSRVSRAEVRLLPVQLDQLIPAIISERPDMQPERARIHIRTPLHPVLAHQPSLAQAITNLLANAVKFVPPGSIPRVQVRTERNNGSVRLWITDNGIGINPKYHHRLFKVFERAHDSALYEGTGIGLAIVRKAAEKMGGKVGVVSDGVSGSSFWIELPAASR